jgi:lysophospholipase L1-like esterase
MAPRRPARTLLAAFTLIAAGCAAADPGTPPAPVDVGEEALRMLAQHRIFFGHQSVGRDLLTGLEELAAAGGPTSLRIVQGRDPALLGPGVLLHDAIGRNEQPLTKLDDFARAIDAGLGGRASVALLKLCYIDFSADSDVDALFARYRSTLQELRARHPSTTFVHVTTPLTTVQQGLKASLRRALGKPVWGERENLKRAAYNARLRQEFAGQPLFDLARLESTTAGGQRHLVDVDGQRAEVLAPIYTDDGGHLNAAGRRVLAAELLRVLGALPAPPAPTGGAD